VVLGTQAGTYYTGASMGSGRGDRNQQFPLGPPGIAASWLQWGPVVVTGISDDLDYYLLQWRYTLQWGPVVVTGISGIRWITPATVTGFNGVRSW